jgi:hypothetical protein
VVERRTRGTFAACTTVLVARGPDPGPGLLAVQFCGDRPPVKPYLETGRPLDAVRNVTVLFCGRCEREFLAKLKEGQDNPTYECPKCKSANRFAIVWR